MTDTIKHPEIYKRDTKGNVRVWYIEQQGANYRTVAGIQNGALVEAGWTTAMPTNVGRSNERDPVAQADFEIAAEYEHKLTREYHRDLSSIDNGAHFFKPMLAAKYEEFAPGFAQPKLDGVRAIIKADGVFSRQGKPIPGAPHIMESLAPLFAVDPDLILDGELYNHELREDFNEVISLVKKASPSPERLAEIREKVQFHAYDLPSSKDPFSARTVTLNLLLGNMPACIQLVPTAYATSEDHFDRLHGEWLTQGYEGSMWRCQNTGYEQKRSKSLRKRKDFDDAEFEVVRIEEGRGNWAGAAKRVICWLPGADRIAGPNDDNTFEAGIAGTYERNAQLLTETHNVVTIRYFGFTPSAIPKPRFGVAKVFHGAERTL